VTWRVGGPGRPQCRNQSRSLSRQRPSLRVWRPRHRATGREPTGLPRAGRPTHDYGVGTASDASPEQSPEALSVSRSTRGYLRPRLLRLGATRAEATTELPRDALNLSATFEATNAITISAPAEAVWPWLVQLGQDRAGFYSYEPLENLAGLDVHNADELVPAWQDLAVGDTIRLAPADHPAVTDEDGSLRVALADPDRALVLRTDDDPPTWTWAFVLAPIDRASCRLVVRSRIAVESPAGRLGAVALEPVSTLLTIGMLRGIRRRAEREWGG
jgi:hypothetical protein